MELNSMALKHNHWERLRGADLSAFAASNSVQEISQAFVKHLAQHGTHEDFFSYINQQTNPTDKCFVVHHFFPQAAQAWLIDQLLHAHTVQQTANLHYKITHQIIDDNLPKKMLQHIDFTTMTQVQHKTLFFELISNDFHSLVTENWNVFEKVCAKTPQDCYLYALSYGLDLGDHIAWSAKTAHERDQYFVACCTGGFLDRITQLRATNEAMAVDAFAGVLRHRPANALEILDHVWTSHPSAPWHTQIFLRPLAKFSLPLAHNLIKYYKITDKHLYNSAALDLLEHAVETKNKELVEFAVPHIKPRDRVEMLVVATATHHRPSIEIILSSFNPHDLPKALHWIPHEQKSMVDEILNQMQSERIKEHLLTCVTNTTVKRKM